MKEIEINSVQEYIFHVENSSPFFHGGHYYRGHSNVDYKLKPTIGRFEIKNGTRIDFEQRLLNVFKQWAFPFLSFRPDNDFEWLLLAQHHSLPTRLLDWSGNALVGLYFAVENLDNSVNACVIEAGFRSIQDMDTMATHNSPFVINNIFGLIVSQKHQRYINQSSLLSIHPNPEEEYTERVIAKYIIPCESKESIKISLGRLGITRRFIFPSLDSVGKDAFEEYSRERVVRE